MKKTLLVALAIIGFGAASSKADVAFSVSFGNHYRPYCAPAPVVVAPAPVVVAPVYRHCPPPVVAAPVYAPVYAAPVAPVYAAPVYPVYPSYRTYHSYGHGHYSRPSSHCGPYGRSGGSIYVGW